jgi:hypothetical protein
VAAHRTAQRTCPVAHRIVQCTHRQQPWPNGYLVVGAINTPNHHILWHPSLFEDHIQYKSSSIHSKTQYKRSNPLRVPNPFQTLSGLCERDFCVHFHSCRLDRLSSFPILFLKCFVSAARDTKCVVVLAGS